MKQILFIMKADQLSQQAQCEVLMLFQLKNKLCFFS